MDGGENLEPLQKTLRLPVECESNRDAWMMRKLWIELHSWLQARVKITAHEKENGSKGRLWQINQSGSEQHSEYDRFKYLKVSVILSQTVLTVYSL